MARAEEGGCDDDDDNDDDEEDEEEEDEEDDDDDDDCRLTGCACLPTLAGRIRIATNPSSACQ